MSNRRRRVRLSSAASIRFAAIAGYLVGADFGVGLGAFGLLIGSTWPLAFAIVYALFPIVAAVRNPQLARRKRHWAVVAGLLSGALVTYALLPQDWAGPVLGAAIAVYLLVIVVGPFLAYWVDPSGESSAADWPDRIG